MATAGASPDSEPVVARQPRPIGERRRRRLPTSDSSATPYTSSSSSAHMVTSVPVPLSTQNPRYEDANEAGDGSRQHPLAYLASSSPSRALSRFWDKLSPPVIPSPFHAASAPSYPPAFLANADLDTVAYSSDRAADTPLPIPIASTSTSSLSMQRPILEQHDSASQLSFSLRRAASPDAGSLPASSSYAGTHPPGSSGSAVAARSASFGATHEGRRQTRRPRTDSWESPFRLPSIPWRGRDRPDHVNSSAIADDDDDDGSNALLGIDEAMVDDEACFVDGWEGKVDFLVSLPSEISLNVLSLLDFRSVLAAGAVSRQWRCLTLDPLLWRDLFHQNPRWHIKPEAYRLAAEAAAQQAAEAAAAVAAAAAFTPSKTSLFGSHSLTPAALSPSLGSSSFFPDRPVMPNLKRAASSFGRTGVKRIVTSADRVSHGGVVIGRKLSEIVGDFNVLSLVPGSTGQSRSSSRAPSEAGDSVNGGGEEGPSNGTRSGTRESSQQSTPSRPPLLSRLSAANGTPTLSLSTAALPSTSTLQTNAFASPPSATVPRSYSSSALSTLSSAFPAAAAVTPARAARPSIATTSPAANAADGSIPPTPSTPAQITAAMEAQDRRMGSEHLDWTKLFRDHWQLDQRWKKGKPSWSWFEGHEDSVYCCQFDERKIVSGSRDRTIRVWDIASGETTHVLRGHEGSVLCLQYDHEILVTGSSDSTVIVWDLVGDPATGRGKYDEMLKLVGHGMGVLDLCFDDRYIVSCSKDTKTHVWERATGTLYRVLQGHRGPVNAVQIQGDRVLTASGDSLMKLWDLHSGQALRTFTGHTRGLACVSWAPSGRYFVSSSNDKTIKLWDASSGECIRTFVGHADLVRGLAYDEKCGRIVSAGYDRTTRIWDAETGEMVHKFNSHSSLVFDVSFSASKIVSSSHDRRILLMDFGVGLDVDKFL